MREKARRLGGVCCNRLGSSSDGGSNQEGAQRVNIPGITSGCRATDGLHTKERKRVKGRRIFSLSK